MALECWPRTGFFRLLITDAPVTFTVYSQVITLGPLARGSTNLGPLLGLANFTGMVEITSTIPIISLSLNFEAFPVFSSLPPGDLPSSTTLVKSASRTSGSSHFAPVNRNIGIPLREPVPRQDARGNGTGVAKNGIPDGS